MPGREGRKRTSTFYHGVDPAEFQRYFVQQGRFTAGTAIQYYPSLIFAEPTHQHLASGLEIGTRFHSVPVVRLSDAKPMHLGHVVEADSRWRLFAFADSGDPTAADSRLHDYEKVFCADLESGDDIFDMRGIDWERGCMVLVRPDQHIAHVLPLDAHDELAEFFARFMLDAS